MIYHWCPQQDWDAAGDGYLPSAFPDDGFVHCSFLDQIEATATALYRGRADLVLLCIEEEGLPVVVEDCYDAGEPFPHVYGPIPRAAVVAAVPFPCRDDGSFPVPAGVPPQ